jgi:hypothetical protein
MSRSILTLALGFGAALCPCLSFAQTANEIFMHAEERYAREEKKEASWSAEARDAAANALDNLKTTRCIEGENDMACRAVVLCSSAPEIAGERLPDDRELKAATKALDDVEDDLKKMAGAMARMRIASTLFERGARAARDRCEAKVRSAFRAVAAQIAQPAQTPPAEAVAADPPAEIYNGPVAIRPMVTSPGLTRKPPQTSATAPQAQ